MASPNCCHERQSTPSSIALPRLVLLPALHPGADLRPVLLPAQPRAVPMLFATLGAAVAELHRLANVGAGDQA